MPISSSVTWSGDMDTGSRNDTIKMSGKSEMTYPHMDI
jgi:hypothetical protein